MDKKTEEIVEHRRLSVAHVVAKRNLDKLEAEFPNKLIGLATSVINSPEHQRIEEELILPSKVRSLLLELEEAAALVFQTKAARDDYANRSVVAKTLKKHRKVNS